MCRVALCGFFLLIAVLPCRAQTFSEWFRQKKTQKKYLLQQVVKLQLYLQYAKKGYNIVNTGLTTISRIKDGDFKLHEFFFAGLSTVNPTIRSYSKTEAALSRIENIHRRAGNAKNLLADNTLFTDEEKNFITGALDNMLQQLLDDAGQLNDLLANNSMQMSDGERLECIDSVYESLDLKEQWVTHLVIQCNLLTRQREKRGNDLKVLQEIYKK